MIRVLALLLLVACRREPAADAPVEAMPPALSGGEMQQARDACARYVDQACACADRTPADPARAETCRLARTLPGALDLALAAEGKVFDSREDALGARANLGKIVKNCVEETARLAVACPAPAAPATPP